MERTDQSAPQKEAHENEEVKTDTVEEVFETNWDLEVKSFDDMGLREEVLRGIFGYGFKEPSPIQQRGILPIIQGKDTIAQAQSGTGKTGAFTIGVLQSIETDPAQAASGHI